MSRRRLVRVAAAALLLLVAPAFVLVATLNLLLARRVFFRQTRLGLGLRPFVLLKFQTMVDGADRGSSVTVHGDPRTTAVGRALRALKLDELPQLINVVRGEMTLVGPRPLTPNEIEAVPRPLAEAVYRRPPGLTGISAIAFVDEERVLARAVDPDRAYYEEVLPRKLALELAYVQRRTALTDLVIVVATPFAPFVPALRRMLVARFAPEWGGLAAAHMTRPRARVEVRR